jgi:hypothetical protein
MKFKDWKFIKLDSGHWIAEYPDNTSSPMFFGKLTAIVWVRNYIKAKKEQQKSKED